MKVQSIPLADILFVFGAWTLMIDSQAASDLKPGQIVDLLDATNVKIGAASVTRFLPSRKPEMHAIEISLLLEPADVKAVKFVRKSLG